jgi:hypothetical protein
VLLHRRAIALLHKIQPSTGSRFHSSRLAFLTFYVVIGAIDFSNACFRQIIKFLIGRGARLFYPYNFYRRFILHILGIKKIDKITCISSANEGAGSQALMVMDAINFCFVNKLTYYHAPFREIAHATKIQEEWAAEWEKFFNFGLSEQCYNESDRTVVNYAYNFSELRLLYNFNDSKFDKSVISGLKKKFRAKNGEKHHTYFVVGVHIRCGDVNFDDYPTRFRDIGAVSDIISKIREVLNNAKLSYRVHVFSEGATEDFATLSKDDTTLFLNRDAVWTLTELINSDVLVLANSRFSYIAGILSNGIILSENWPRALEGWILLRKSCKFNIKEFEDKLRQYIELSPPERGFQARALT